MVTSYKSICLCWFRDTAGQEKYHSIATNYYRGAKGIIITYDITNRKSFENISNWVATFKKVGYENILVCFRTFDKFHTAF